MRLKNLRATGLTGALLSTTIIAVAPAVADSDAQSQTTTAAAPAPATAKTAVPTPVATKASSSLTVSSVRRTVIAGKRVVVRGTLRPAGSGRAVALQVRQSGGGYKTVDHDRTNAKGRYVLAWRAAKTGTRRIRVHFGGTRELSSARHQAGTTRVYRRALASWYGPGLYGGHLACGGTLTPGTLGVANKSLPCGTKVTFRHNGRVLRVPVIDRGPYVAGRTWDLSRGLCDYLDHCYTGSIEWRWGSRR